MQLTCDCKTQSEKIDARGANMANDGADGSAQRDEELACLVLLLGYHQIAAVPRVGHAPMLSEPVARDALGEFLRTAP